MMFLLDTLSSRSAGIGVQCQFWLQTAVLQVLDLEINGTACYGVEDSLNNPGV